jgi:hypothetical protein
MNIGYSWSFHLIIVKGFNESTLKSPFWHKGPRHQETERLIN